MTTIPRNRALTPIERRLVRGCAGIPGSGPRGESCGTCSFFFQHYDGRRGKRVFVCSARAGSTIPINSGIAACRHWQPVPSRAAELEAEEIATMARGDDDG